MFEPIPVHQQSAEGEAEPCPVHLELDLSGPRRPMQQLPRHRDDCMPSKLHTIAAHAHAHVAATRRGDTREQVRSAQLRCEVGPQRAVRRATDRVLVHADARREAARGKVVRSRRRAAFW